MNKFVAVKAVSAAAYDRALARLSAGALDALTFHPDRIWLYEDRDRLTFFASYALQAGAGFRKDYVDLGSQHVFAFDGLPYTRDIDVDRSWAAQINEAWSSDQAALENIFGTWAAFRMDRDGLCALSDFTGMTPLFYWHDTDYLAISTRQMLLTTSCGAQVPNLEGLAWLTGQANLIGDQTAWQGVRHLPPQWTLSVSRRAGDLQPVFSKREIWTADIDLQFKQADIDDIAHKLLEQCEALNRLPLPPLQVDITGGLDSRLTTALLSASASSLRSRISHLQTRVSMRRMKSRSAVRLPQSWVWNTARSPLRRRSRPPTGFSIPCAPARFAMRPESAPVTV